MNIRFYYSHINWLSKNLCCRKSVFKKCNFFPLFFLLACIITLEFYTAENITDEETTPTISAEVSDAANIRQKIRQPEYDYEDSRKTPNLRLFRDASINNQSRRIQNIQKLTNGSNELVLSDEEEKNRRIRRQKRAPDHPFGRRPFGPFSKFTYPAYPDHSWVAYFLEETLVPVLLTHERVMIDCTVIELRTEEEQRAALDTFGSVMGIEPASLPEMVRLIKLCGELPKNKIQVNEDDLPDRERSGRQSSFILPGTLWCGIRDRAPRYENLGHRKRLDNCCRAHDHCPIKISGFESRYGLTNFGFGTRSHCYCDDQFFRCLKEVGNEVANLIGNFYFDILRIECIKPLETRTPEQAGDHDALMRPLNNLYYCQTSDNYKRCKYWTKRNVNYNYKFERFRYRY